MAAASPNFGTRAAVPPNGFPATIASSGAWHSGIIPAGYGAISAGLTSSQAGVLSIQRYADSGGLIPIGAAISANLSANTAQWVDVSDGVPYLFFQVSATNSGGSTANVTNAAILTGPISAIGG